MRSTIVFLCLFALLITSNGIITEEESEKGSTPQNTVAEQVIEGMENKRGRDKGNGYNSNSGNSTKGKTLKSRTGKGKGANRDAAAVPDQQPSSSRDRGRDRDNQSGKNTKELADRLREREIQRGVAEAKVTFSFILICFTVIPKSITSLVLIQVMLREASDERCDWRVKPLEFIRGEVCGSYYKVCISISL